MNIIMDDTLIFFDEDESSNPHRESRDSDINRSAKWVVDLGSKIFKRVDSYAELIEKVVRDEPELNDMDAYFVQVGPAFEPRPFNLKNLSERIPYSNPEIMAKRLAAAADRGWLEEMRGPQYFVSSCGRGLRDKLVALAESSYAEISVIADEDLVRLDELLAKVIKSALAENQPKEKIALSWSRKFDLGQDKSLLSRVRRRLVDLFAFRDDAHVAAWKAHEQRGYVWEAFTYVWNDDANTPEELARRLSHRGYSEHDYRAAIGELVERGWLTKLGDIYKATPGGNALREAVEAQTNKYFDQPWHSLSEKETIETKQLLEKLENKLQLENAIV